MTLKWFWKFGKSLHISREGHWNKSQDKNGHLILFLLCQQILLKAKRQLSFRCNPAIVQPGYKSVPAIIIIKGHGKVCIIFIQIKNRKLLGDIEENWNSSIMTYHYAVQSVFNCTFRNEIQMSKITLWIDIHIYRWKRKIQKYTSHKNRNKKRIALIKELKINI